MTSEEEEDEDDFLTSTGVGATVTGTLGFDDDFFVPLEDFGFVLVDRGGFSPVLSEGVLVFLCLELGFFLVWVLATGATSGAFLGVGSASLSEEEEEKDTTATSASSSFFSVFFALLLRENTFFGDRGDFFSAPSEDEDFCLRSGLDGTFTALTESGLVE